MARVFLGLGSNVGDGIGIVHCAFQQLNGLLRDASLSRLWRSRALYFEDQPDFVNAAATGNTDLSPRELLAAVNSIERDFGRDRTRELIKGPRSLDIDILLYGSLSFNEDGLVIPHAGLKERRFALLPILDLDDGLVDPISSKPYSEILETLPPQGIYLIE